MGARAHRRGAGTAGAVRVALKADLRGRLVRRYRRFLADVETEDGAVVTVHCPDPGSMRDLAVEGAPVRCSTSPDPRRKLRHTLEMIRRGPTWVGVHTLRANQVARAALEHGALRGLAGYRELRREVRAPADAGGGRIDFLLERHARGRPPAWLEVKSVTLREGSAARFPDSVTARGRRHVETLARLRAAGARAALLFVVQRADCQRVEPADDIDPAYAEALRDAARAGVEVLAVATRVSPRALVLERALPVRLGARPGTGAGA